MIRSRSWIVFLTLFGAYAYFHQGGGWNQNSRFNQIRALVEDGRWSINHFSAYRAGGETEEGLERVPIPDPMLPGSSTPPLNALDIALHEGRIFPNKPPGTTLLALPAYAVVHALRQQLAEDPDGWWPLTLSFYLTTVFSSGLLGALLGVVLCRLSRRLHPDVEERWHALSALAFGLGTLAFPFATMLFDHTAAATAGLGGFALLIVACDQAGRKRRTGLLFATGWVLGLGVVINYTIVLLLPLLCLYAAARLGRRALELGFLLLGGGVPAAFLLGYHEMAFASPWALANTYQHELFLEPDGHFLGVFALPDLGVAAALLAGSERGLFTSSPVLLLAIYGFCEAFRDRRRRREALVCLTAALVFLLMNASFNAWHGGNSYGPRYLLPAVPLVGLFLAPAFARRPRASAAWAALSVSMVLTATAVDPQIPADVENPWLHIAAGIASENPVSRNPLGFYEAFPFRVFEPESLQAKRNSFNLGEFLLPQRPASLLPLLLLVAWGTNAAVRARPQKASRAAAGG